MSYLLTNGIKTDNVDLYLRDILHLNFKLNPLDIPYNTELGIERRIHEVSLVEFQDTFRIGINSFLSKLNDRHNLNLTIVDMEVTTSKINLKINLGSEENIDYELPLTN